MSRIGERFANLQVCGRTGLIPYVTGGDPSPRMTVRLMHALARAGAEGQAGMQAFLERHKPPWIDKTEKPEKNGGK